MTDAQTNPGIGTLAFVANSTEVFGRIRLGNDAYQTVRGTLENGVISVAGGRFQLTGTPIPPSQRVDNGPVARLTLLDRSTGATEQVVMWRPKNAEAKAYGLSFEQPLEPQETHLPF